MLTRKAIHTALEIQKQGLGFSIVEVLSPCPVGWNLSLEESREYIDDVLAEYFPLGVFRDRREESATAESRRTAIADAREVLAERTAEKGLIRTAEPCNGYALPLRLLVSGQGGQGSLFLGALLAEAGHLEGRISSWYPEYGPEQRGGTANCGVVLSEDKIGSPCVSEPDVLIAMNQPSLDKFERTVRPGGVIIYNSSLIKRSVERDDVKAIAVPASEIARELGSGSAANMVLLGALLQETNALSYETVLATLRREKKASEANLEAILRGREFR